MTVRRRVFKHLKPVDDAASRRLNSLRKAVTLHLMIENTRHMRAIDPAEVGQLGLGNPDTFEFLPEGVHTSSVCSETAKKSIGCNDEICSTVQNENMTQRGWKYRDAFDAEYRAYRHRTKATVENVADALGVSVSSVNSYRRLATSKAPPAEPPLDVIIMAATLFGCSPFKFMDDPRIIEGLPPLPSERMGLVNRAAQILADPDLSFARAKALVDELGVRAMIMKTLK